MLCGVQHRRNIGIHHAVPEWRGWPVSLTHACMHHCRTSSHHQYLHHNYLLISQLLQQLSLLPASLSCSAIVTNSLLYSILTSVSCPHSSGTVTVHYQGGGEKFESFTLASELSFNLYVSGLSAGGGGGGIDPGIVGILLIIL